MQEGEDEAFSSAADADAQRPGSTEAQSAASSAPVSSTSATEGEASQQGVVPPDSISEPASSPQPEAPGELLIRGPNIFSEYWRKPDATADAFTSDGFFRSGDTASVEQLPGPGGPPAPYWRILGRTSVDILKSGGDCPSSDLTESKCPLLHGYLLYNEGNRCKPKQPSYVALELSVIAASTHRIQDLRHGCGERHADTSRCARSGSCGHP